ncbi:MAG: NAD(P)-binding domain-containing protein [Rhizobiaceae bacterium]|nr:NAD(P)-binding domain-containing protein [Rhizobiaceae bacterium]
MDIAIIGAGRVGFTLATAWAKAGHQASLIVRDPSKIASEAARIGASAVKIGDMPDGKVIVLATPYAAAAEILKSLGNLAGKIIIDCTNPLGMVDGKFGLLLGHNTSGSETLAGVAPDARIVKTLNQVGAEIMAAAKSFPTPPAMFMASDSEDAKDVVSRLLTDIGFDALDAGGLDKARLLEPYALVWINQAMAQGKGRNWALSISEIANA